MRVGGKGICCWSINARVDISSRYTHISRVDTLKYTCHIFFGYAENDHGPPG